MENNLKNIVILLLILVVSCVSCSSDEANAQRIMKSICDNDFDYFYAHSFNGMYTIDYIINNYSKGLRPIEMEKAHNKAKLLAETGDWKQYGPNGSAWDYYKLRQAIGSAECNS